MKNDSECKGNSIGKVERTYFTQFKYKKDQKKYERMGMSKDALDFYEWCLNNNRLILTQIIYDGK